MSDHQQETEALLRLSLCKGVSNRTIYALIQRFGSAGEALRAPAGELERADGLTAAARRAVQRGADEARVERELALMEVHGVRLVPFFSDDYPAPLKHLDADAPALLRVQGDYTGRDELAIAVVGARRCSAYGRDQAGRMACDLAGMGFTVISGLAYGIDTAAHRGALMGGGRTIAVLGCGLGCDMPEHVAQLADDIAANGALMSELPMEAPPRPGNFPPRNRIISGLSLGVAVIEAAARSGSLITARLAGEQGKAVFALPGNVDSPTSRGCHMLIRDGATLVTSARDLVEDLGPLTEPFRLPAEEGGHDEPQQVTDPRMLTLNDRERRILDMLTSTPMHIDGVVAETDLPPSVVASTLLTMEIRGLLRQVAGQRYVRR